MKERINLLLPSVMVYTRISWWNWGKKTIFFSPMLSIKQYLQKIYPKPFFFFLKIIMLLTKTTIVIYFIPTKESKLPITSSSNNFAVLLWSGLPITSSTSSGGFLHQILTGTSITVRSRWGSGNSGAHLSLKCHPFPLLQ